MSGWGTGSRQPHAGEERTGCAPGARTSVSAPVGIHPQTSVPMGKEQPWIGPATVRWASIRAHRPRGPRNRVAGGRTSVSAPLGSPRKKNVPMGSETIRTGQPPTQKSNMKLRFLRAIPSIVLSSSHLCPHPSCHAPNAAIILPRGSSLSKVSRLLSTTPSAPRNARPG